MQAGARYKKEYGAQHKVKGKSGGTVWNYVAVSMRGTVADLQVMRSRLDKFGLHDAMVVARRLVEGAGAAKGVKTR